jgi:hypothetical protein
MSGQQMGQRKNNQKMPWGGASMHRMAMPRPWEGVHADFKLPGQFRSLS